jgi:hypothetical protein
VIDRKQWLSCCVGLVLSASAIEAQAPSVAPVGLIWTHASGVESWVGKTVALSDRGSALVSAFGPYSDFTRVFSGTDANPPVPLFQSSSSEPTFHHAVAGAHSNDLVAVLHDTYADATLQTRKVWVRRIRASDPANNWNYQWPNLTNGHDSLTVRVPRDGSRIVAVVHNHVTNKADVRVFSPISPVPLSSFSLSLNLAFRGLDLSADGTRLLISSSLVMQVFNLNTGAVEHTEYLFEPLYSGMAISGDGSRFAYGTSGLARFFKRNTGGFYAQEFSISAPAGSWACDRLDLSDDGTGAALLFNNTNGFHDVLVQGVDCVSRTVSMSDLVHGTGTLQNAAADVSISADGQRFVAAVWGDSSPGTEEVRLYSRTQNAPLWVYDLPGSAMDAEISSDGKRFAIASKAVHANSGGGGGRIDLFRAADEDLIVIGRPIAGNTVEVRTQGNHGQPAVLLKAPLPATNPTFFPSLGTLYIDRATLSYLPMGSFNEQGVATRQLTLPATPGSQVFLQGFATQPRTLGTSWLGLTVAAP